MAIPNSNTRRNAVDLTGREFGRWTVIRYYDKITYKYGSRGSTCLRWLCRCRCGNEKVVRGNTLTNGTSVSCRCYQKEFQRAAKTIHGHSASVDNAQRGTPEYHAWSHMMQRCFNSACPEYHNYGGRGITVCSRWRIAEHFIADVGARPSPKHSLDRFPDNDGNYEPRNVRWATTKEQMRNQRRNVWVEWKGRRQIVKDWALEMGVNPHTLGERIRRKWTVERAMTTPFNRQPDYTSPPTPD